MQDHYKTLGVNSSATTEEIRRAYRILARRYHPDLNPGEASEERFKSISLAYKELSDPQKKQAYDLEYEANQISRFSKRLKDYQYNQEYSGRRTVGGAKRSTNTKNSERQRGSGSSASNLTEQLLESPLKRVSTLWNSLKRHIPVKNKSNSFQQGTKLSIIEVSLSIRDAIKGVKKTIEIQELPGNPRKLSVQIPAGVRNGSVVRLKERRAKGVPEEIVLIIRLAHNPLLNILPKGLVIELPISLREAVEGASVTVPTLDEPAVIKIPEGTQSGSEIRLKGRGIKLRDGTSGDIIYRVIVKVPTAYNAVGIKELASQFDKYYEEPLRKSLPNSLLDL